MKTLPAVFFLVVTFVFGCSKEDPSGWYIDATFSSDLTSYWEYPGQRREDPAKSVAVLQIIRTRRGKRVFTLKEIRAEQRIYETRDWQEILTLFHAARIETKGTCDFDENDFVYFILAFDRDLMRVGILQYFPCKRGDLGWFQKWNSRSVYFSSELAKKMTKIIPPDLERKQ